MIEVDTLCVFALVTNLYLEFRLKDGIALETLVVYLAHELVTILTCLVRNLVCDLVCVLHFTTLLTLVLQQHYNFVTCTCVVIIQWVLVLWQHEVSVLEVFYAFLVVFVPWI